MNAESAPTPAPATSTGSRRLAAGSAAAFVAVEGAGDVVVLESGDRVPADGRLLSGAALRIEEASLTGESRAVLKQTLPLPEGPLVLGDRTNLVYAGTSVAVGRGHFVVTATGQAIGLRGRDPW